jgi:hypothetical protein
LLGLSVGGWLAKVESRLIAKTVTAVISVIAETGSHDHADGKIP